MVPEAGPIAVVMALYRPDPVALERQVRSILAQRGCSVRLHLFADGSMDRTAPCADLPAADDRVSFTRFAANRGAAITFLEGLATVHQNAPETPIAFADQDDLWHPEKLARSAARLARSGAGAVHGDARVVDATGSLIAPSLVALERRVRDPDLAELFFRNNATGMTMLIAPRTAGLVARLRHLRPEGWLHDHFVAFLAAATQGLAFEPAPLVDYVQHGGNAVGAGRPRLRQRSSFGFLDSQGASAKRLAEGRALVRALAEPTSGGDAEPLALLRDILETRGPRSLLRFASFLCRHRGWPRALAMRLAWEKAGLAGATK